MRLVFVRPLSIVAYDMRNSEATAKSPGGGFSVDTVGMQNIGAAA